MVWWSVTSIDKIRYNFSCGIVMLKSGIKYDLWGGDCFPVLCVYKFINEIDRILNI